MKKQGYIAATLALLMASGALYLKGWRLRIESFALGMSYVLPAAACLGLSIVTGVMAMLESAAAPREQVAE